MKKLLLALLLMWATTGAPQGTNVAGSPSQTGTNVTGGGAGGSGIQASPVTFPGYGSTLTSLYLFQDAIKSGGCSAPTTLADSSGNGNNSGTISGSVYFLCNSIAGQAGVQFNAAGEYVPLPAVLNTSKGLFVAIEFDNAANRNCAAPIIGNGNGAFGHAPGITLKGPQNQADVFNLNSAIGIIGGAGTITADAYSGRFTLGESLDTSADVFYFNGAVPQLVTGTGGTQGLLTVGNYQLGGDANQGANYCAVTPTWFTGNMYIAATWSVEPTAAMQAGAAQWAAQYLAQNGTPEYTGWNTFPNASGMVVAIGDSIDYGTIGSTTSWMTRIQPSSITGALGYYKVNNSTQIGHKCGDMTPATYGMTAALAPIFPTGAGSGYGSGVAVVFNDCGVNDLVTAYSTPLQIQQYHIHEAQVLHSLGFKYIVETIAEISSSNIDTNRNLANNLTRSLVPQFIDGLADIAAFQNIGANGDCVASSTWCQSDGVHHTQVTIDDLETPLKQGLVDYLYGFNNFSQANTYSAANITSTQTAVANTAFSDTTGTVTYTNALNPGANTEVLCTGTLPTAYSGYYYVLTSSGTNFTATNVNGLGALSTAGTCALAFDMKYGDKYSNWNCSSACAPRILPATGLTGQQLWFRNTGAFQVTLTPVVATFAGSTNTLVAETIDGQGSYLLNPGKVLCLTSVLVGATTGGDNWQTCTPSTPTPPCLITSGAGPLACGSADNGTVAIPTTTATYTINTTKVTANSKIFITPTTDNTGIPGGPTCVLPTLTADPSLSARVSGTSFTIAETSTTGITCYNWFLVN